MTDADQELYKNFPLVISERWQNEVAETVFETVNFEADKMEHKKKQKQKQKFDLDEKGCCLIFAFFYFCCCLFRICRIRLYSAWLYKKIRWSVDVELADALCEIVSKSIGIASGLGETGNDIYGSGRGGQFGFSAGQK